MAIPQELISDFELLVQYAQRGKIALLETTDITTGEPVYAIVGTESLGGDPLLTPLAKMFIGDPFKQLVPPHDSVTMSPEEVQEAMDAEKYAFSAPATLQ